MTALLTYGLINSNSMTAPLTYCLINPPHQAHAMTAPQTYGLTNSQVRRTR